MSVLRKAVAGLSLAALAGLIAGCGGGETEGGTAGKALKTYRHAMDQAPTNLDPVQAATVYSNYVVSNAYDTLYSYKYLARPYELKPNLAVDFPEVSDDGLTYTIRIKQGVRFIDDDAFPGGVGRELTAHDFVYSIKRHFDPASRSQGAWLWQGRIEGIDAWKDAGSDYAQDVPGLTALDDYTIEIRLTKPYPQLTYTLAQGFSGIVPREAVEKYGRELSVRPVGSGPFKVEFFDTSRAVMSRNPHFRQEPVDIYYEGYEEAKHGYTGVLAIHGRSPPFIDRLEIHFIPENATRWNSFTKGDEVHFSNIPNEQIDRTLASKNPVTLKPEYAERYNMYAGTEAGFVFHSFNLDIPAFGYNDDPERERRNKALRCAVIKGFDWEERNERFYFGLGNVFPGVIPPVVPEFDPELSRDSVTRDVAGARKLLADNGWTAENLPEMVYGTTSSVIQRQYYEQFRSWMQEIGYPKEKIVLKQYAAFGEISKAWKQSELPMINKGWGLDYPDAENTLQLFYGPNGSPGSNDTNYRNPQYDALYKRAAVMQPGPERTELYRQMNRMVIDDCLAITGIARTRVLLWHKNVIAYPDREILGGFFLKYVDLAEEPAGSGSGS